MNRHPIAVAVVFATIAVGSLVGVSHAKLCFNATIDGAQAGTGSSATGTGRFELSDDETVLTYNITFSGLSSAETAAHIHSDAEGGGVVEPLPTGSPKIGQWTSTDGMPMTPARVADLKAGQLYVNIHTTNFPGGEIRGQILSAPCELQCFEATINSSQTGTGSPATGFGVFTLNHTETELSYHVEYTGLEYTETGAHIHNNVEGGTIVRELELGSPKVGIWKFDDPSPLTPTRVMNLQHGRMYVNIHSTVFPAGEIAGDILPVTCTPTAAGDVPGRATALEQNHPNPFNPSTTIEFTLASAGRARLDVYDVSGRHVATLVDAVLPGGRNSARWDGRDAGGNAVSSGVYFYRLVTGGRIETRKMVLLK